MRKHSDEALVAYLDGELDDAGRDDVEAWLAADPAVRERLAGLARSGDLARAAFADILDEPVPERLVAAAGGRSASGGGTPARDAEIVPLRPRRAAPPPAGRRSLIAMAAAAALFGVMFGGVGTYVGMVTLLHPNAAGERRLAAAANDRWLDNAAGYYKLSVNAGGNMLIDVPARNDTSAALQRISQSLPQQVRLPDLKPWGLTFRGARLVVAEGRPAAELVYTTDNKALGPLTLVIGATRLPDLAPTFNHRDDVNLLYWRHHGHAYALVSKADVGWLWGIANDVAWQLDAI